MADAKINLSLSPAEFDLLRETIETRINFISTKLKMKTEDLAKDLSTDYAGASKVRRQYTETMAQLSLMLEKLK
jgi:hypothetical protein